MPAKTIRKQIYKITYPNRKIYVGMDLTGTFTYFGSPSASAKERIAADHADQRLDLTVRKQILWESEAATDAEVRAIERQYIREAGANNPAVGYNLTPRYLQGGAAGEESQSGPLLLAVASCEPGRCAPCGVCCPSAAARCRTGPPAWPSALASAVARWRGSRRVGTVAGRKDTCRGCP